MQLHADAALLELAGMRLDGAHLGVDGRRDVDVGARMERHRHGAAGDRLVGEEIEIREPLARHARLVHEHVVAVELGGAVREHRRRRALAHLAVDHRHELVALQVFDAPRAVGHQHAQLAAEDASGALRLAAAQLVVAGKRNHGHHHARAGALQLRERAARRELDVVGVRADREHGLAGVARLKQQADTPPAARS